jgi:Asp-tRNA(Asn)/Glu-tRNA(Gln) amidotransferase A subunit family amidase
MDLRDWKRRAEIGNGFSNGVLIGPATTTPPPGAETTGDPVLNSPWSFFGLATVSLPVGWTDDGLPVSAQIVAPSEYKEIRALSVAAVLENTIALTRRLPPVS